MFSCFFQLFIFFMQSAPQMRCGEPCLDDGCGLAIGCLRTHPLYLKLNLRCFKEIAECSVPLSFVILVSDWIGMTAPSFLGAASEIWNASLQMAVGQLHKCSSIVLSDSLS